MKRLFLGVVVAGVLAGCVAARVDKNLLFNALYQNEIAVQIQDQTPELLYCFDRPPAQLEEEMTAIGIGCLNAIIEGMPEELDDTVTAGRQQLRRCRRNLFLNRNSAAFTTRYLYGEKLARCQALQAELEALDPTFVYIGASGR